MTRQHIDWVFLTAATLGTFSFFVRSVRNTATCRASPPEEGRRCGGCCAVTNPGLILLMSVATGIGLNLPTVFLATYMEELHLADGLMIFFNLYPPIAFVTRVSMRRVPDRLGIRPMIALGIAALVVGLWSLIPVRETWHLVIPALFIGVAHASLFRRSLRAAAAHFQGDGAAPEPRSCSRCSTWARSSEHRLPGDSHRDSRCRRPQLRGNVRHRRTVDLAFGHRLFGVVRRAPTRRGA